MIPPFPAASSKCRTESRNISCVLPHHLLEGRKGERIACSYLLRQGFDVLARRYRATRGEIDLIAFEADVLVFVEVKTRSSAAFGAPAEFVDWQKQQSLRQAAEEFIAQYDLGRYSYRFDIVSVLAPGTPQQEVELYRNAF